MLDDLETLPVQLEELNVGADVKGIIPGETVTVLATQWYGSAAVELTYKTVAGQTGSEMLYRDREAELEAYPSRTQLELERRRRATSARFRGAPYPAGAPF